MRKWIPCFKKYFLKNCGKIYPFTFIHFKFFFKPTEKEFFAVQPCSYLMCHLLACQDRIYIECARWMWVEMWQWQCSPSHVQVPKCWCSNSCSYTTSTAALWINNHNKPLGREPQQEQEQQRRSHNGLPKSANSNGHKFTVTMKAAQRPWISSLCCVAEQFLVRIWLKTLTRPKQIALRMFPNVPNRTEFSALRAYANKQLIKLM